MRLTRTLAELTPPVYVDPHVAYESFLQGYALAKLNALDAAEARETVDGMVEELAEFGEIELRSILSRAANHTPKVVYYAKDFADQMETLPIKVLGDGTKMNAFQQAAMLLCTTAGRSGLEIDTQFEATFTGLEHGDQNLGTFKITIERLATD